VNPIIKKSSRGLQTFRKKSSNEVILKKIYEPIADNLKAVEDKLWSSVRESKDRSILTMSNFLLESPGKRIRPALVILCERAASADKKRAADDRELIEVATAVELIHIASLIHDDVLDKATMRHRISSVNTRYGDGISIIFGDYIYSKAFQLIGNCRNPALFSCMSKATSLMCEGELIHIQQRGNLKLSKRSYIDIVKKKTASLFEACCQLGAMVGEHSPAVQKSLRAFGLNFGIAFQIIDDCRDMLSEESELGKHPGQDLVAGDITLPLLILLELVGQAEREQIKSMLGGRRRKENFERLREMLVDSDTLAKIRSIVVSYLQTASKHLNLLADSTYKKGLLRLVDYMRQKNHFAP